MAEKETKKVNLIKSVIALAIVGIIIGVLLGMVTEACMILLTAVIITAMETCTNALIKNLQT